MTRSMEDCGLYNRTKKLLESDMSTFLEQYSKEYSPAKILYDFLREECMECPSSTKGGEQSCKFGGRIYGLADNFLEVENGDGIPNNPIGLAVELNRIIQEAKPKNSP